MAKRKMRQIILLKSKEPDKDGKYILYISVGTYLLTRLQQTTNQSTPAKKKNQSLSTIKKLKTISSKVRASKALEKVTE